VSGLSVYGIIAADPDGLGSGLANEPLRTVGSGPVRAIVGDLAEPPRAEPATLTAHDATVRRLADRIPALLPARFGQWLPDERAVTDWLEAHHRELAEALARIAGCVQMTLRVYSASDIGENQAPDPTSIGGPGTQYLTKRRQQFERERSLPEIAPLRDALRPLLRAERIERPAAPGRLRATAYDLIAREATDDYSRIVAETAPRLAGFRVTASGPWPPYAFAPRPLA
jgi:hypothetical protein